MYITIVATKGAHIQGDLLSEVIFCLQANGPVIWPMGEADSSVGGLTSGS